MNADFIFDLFAFIRRIFSKPYKINSSIATYYLGVESVLISSNSKLQVPVKWFMLVIRFSLISLVFAFCVLFVCPISAQKLSDFGKCPAEYGFRLVDLDFGEVYFSTLAVESLK